LTKHHSVVYTTQQPLQVREHATFQLNHTQAELKKTLERLFQNVQLCNRELGQLRSIKREPEVAAIERAVALTVAGFEAMKSILQTAKHEYELAAVFDYEFRRRGGRHAYEPIIASGSNACTLHYIQNDSALRRRDLVLFDVGARVDGYAADISRTYAIGTPTKRQRQVHEAVRDAQAECIALLKPGLKFEEYHHLTERRMKTALGAIGFSEERYREYFPHALGHGLGIDVHDVLAGYDELRPGMVLTVEPGIYIREEGIGVRIEDDILITDDGHRNLTGHLSTHLG
jgi:Xaa-Pro aminopeptidase